MKLRSLATCLVALPLAAITGCSLFGESEGTTLVAVDDLVTWVERVHVNSELSKEKANEALQHLQAIASANYGGDALGAHKGLVAAIDGSERQSRALNQSVLSMKQTAEKVFERWSTDLMQFSSMEMRLRSQNRLLRTRERYEAIVAAVGPAQESYTGFNKRLRDHALFLGHDFNETSVAEIADGVQSLSSVAVELDGKFDAVLQAARDYVETAALPINTDPNAAPGPGAGTQTQRDFGRDQDRR